jgi:hypothetical protein
MPVLQSFWWTHKTGIISLRLTLGEKKIPFDSFVFRSRILLHLTSYLCFCIFAILSSFSESKLNTVSLRKSRESTLLRPKSKSRSENHWRNSTYVRRRFLCEALPSNVVLRLRILIRISNRILEEFHFIELPEVRKRNHHRFLCEKNSTY